MSKDCDCGCGELERDRLRYFTGRHMTARDFRDEQAYQRTHRLLHNRMLHDWGVVCGLYVRQHQDPECRRKVVKIDCGFALDCCGRELPVPKQTVLDIPWDGFDPAGNKTLLLICLQYCETPIEPLPVLYDEQNCDPQRREHTRIREGWRLEGHWIQQSDLPAYYWKTIQGPCPPPDDGPPCLKDDCDDGQPPEDCCLEPHCPPDHCVPLAVITVKEKNQQIVDDDINRTGRPSLEPPRHALTNICWTSWEHGKTYTRDEVASNPNLSSLKIRFNRRIKTPANPDPYGPSGVNACTFLVQFGGEAEDLDFVQNRDKLEPHVEHDCMAVFDMDPGKKKEFAFLEDHTVFVTLHCDFILDCHDRAVDGNHLGGVLPTGDGVPGGTFISWFHVIPDDGGAKTKEQAK